MTPIYRRWLSTVPLSLLALTLFLSPLASGTGVAPSASAQEKVLLTLWIFEGEEQLLPALEAAFETQHPDISLEITLIPEDQYVVKIDTALAAGSPPDIGFLYEQRWVKAGKILPLGEMIAAHGIDLAQFNQAVMQGRCFAEGEVYCLGSYTGATVLYYNKALFDAAGLSYPTATTPMTVDEYAALAAQLSSPTSRSASGSGAGPPSRRTGGWTTATCLAPTAVRRPASSTTRRPSTRTTSSPTWSSRATRRATRSCSRWAGKPKTSSSRASSRWRSAPPPHQELGRSRHRLRGGPDPDREGR